MFQNVELQSLWKDQPVVLFFLRRFGCQICRWIAAEISKLEPDLRASGVALVGIGPEEFGLKDFKDGGFFKGCKQVTHGGCRLFHQAPVIPMKSIHEVTTIIPHLYELNLDEEIVKLQQLLIYTIAFFFPENGDNHQLSFVSAIYVDEKKKSYKDLGFKR